MHFGSKHSDAVVAKTLIMLVNKTLELEGRIDKLQKMYVLGI